MASTQRANEPETTSRTRTRLLEPLYESLLLKIAVVGVFLIAVGAILSEGVWAAIVAVWGIGLLLTGLGFYGFIWWRRN
ncbi:hypothetical protein [Halosolutus gelatinilyticus]|uniref:hypothetical protein n=1 Tax=Halosolutus gelatinilyticus TaxID=2931975 RepID=UPI001FF2ECB3|nr:hypothetical protein [Halosolutus gelatinilyticus]